MSCHVYVGMDAGNGFETFDFDIPQIYGKATAVVHAALSITGAIGDSERYQDVMQVGTLKDWKERIEAAFLKLVTHRGTVQDNAACWHEDAADAADHFLRACLIACHRYPAASFVFSC